MDQTTVTADPTILGREVYLAARPETVYAYFVDPQRIVRWMGKVATLEPVPGGLFRVDYGQGDVARGEYRELDPPRRVVFTWGWEQAGDPVPPGGSTVEVELEPEGDGTRLRLRHLGLPTDSQAGHGEGWDYFLGRLSEAVARP
jgi:uncharacterized protein YndB with AHSA1/START domain